MSAEILLVIMTLCTPNMERASKACAAEYISCIEGKKTGFLANKLAECIKEGL